MEKTRTRAAVFDTDVPDRGLPTPDDDERCRVCSQNWAWHVEHRPRHVFENSRGERIPVQGKEPAQRPRLPTDPILRALLIEKGVITVEEIEKKEAELKATGVILAQASD